MFTVMKEVIIKLLEHSKLNVKQFSEKLGMKRAQAIYDIMSGKTKRISEKLASQIISEFPEINKTWLLTGEGEMFVKPSYSQDSSPTVLADDHSTAIAGNKNIVNADQTIAMLVAEVAAQRRLTEKVLEQNSELLAMVAVKVNKAEEM